MKGAGRNKAAAGTRFSIFLERKSEDAPGKAKAKQPEGPAKNVDGRTLGFKCGEYKADLLG
ncbi:hypothetical protein [Ferrovibrio sp.]|uniref:hypothetical protein n=1 Tax=Ferrovibrio sp. TaxID=1917215 RepID=UPI002615307C|nr:hypothetical protein [Ferrovibrio sp.]